ncbi:MAG: NAD(P)H-dependent oxidoreductase, partial [Aequorivita sp.]|nr:NAD(P)H-dependent oxidoreductase [Aequorivita sp.]
MKNIFIINGHQKYPFAQGKLNSSLVEMAKKHFESLGYAVKLTTMEDDYDVNEEIEKFKWADVVFLQSPINWMGAPWS